MPLPPGTLVGFTNSAGHVREAQAKGLTGTKLLGPLLLLVIDIDCDDARSVLRLGTLDERKTDASDTEDGDVRVL